MHSAFLHDIEARLADEIWVLVWNWHLAGFLFCFFDTWTAVHILSMAHVAEQLAVASAMDTAVVKTWVEALAGLNRFPPAFARQQPRMDSHTKDGAGEIKVTVALLP